MSETKAKVKVKARVEGEEVPAKPKLFKSPHTAEAAVKVKKEAKHEPDSPAGKKKHSETPLKTPKKETEVTIKAAKKEETIKTRTGEVTRKVKVVKKEEVVVSSGSSLKKKKASKDEPDKKTKKVYSLPGQKHDPPDERDPLRIFYESLYGQNSKSEMAEIWMMEHGLLEHDVAKKAFERKKRNQGNQKLGSPVKQLKEVKSEKKSSTTAVIVKSQKKSPAEKSTKKSNMVNGDTKPSKVKRTRDSDSDSDDDDFILKPKKKAKASA